MALCSQMAGAFQSLKQDIHSPTEGPLTVSMLFTDPGLPGWRGPYLSTSDRAPELDPWGSPLRITGSGDRIKVQSAGPDRVWETADDVGTR